MENCLAIKIGFNVASLQLIKMDTDQSTIQIGSERIF